MATATRILAEYDQQLDLYQAFTASLRDVLTNLLKAAQIETLPPDGRTKSRESFEEKLFREEKSRKYKKLNQVTDLSGVRIVAYTQADCDQICTLIRKNFKIDEENSVDKGRDEEDRFGYASRHLIVSYKYDRYRLPELSIFKGLKAEIQIRTLLQHTWAALDWKLRYKSSGDVPRDLRRKLFRISALLETADDEFAYLTSGIEDLRNAYRGSIRSGNYELELNSESLSIFVEEDWDSGGITQKIARLLIEEKDLKISDHLGDGDTGASRIIKTAEILGITTIRELSDAARRGLEEHPEAFRVVFGNWNGRTTQFGLLRLSVVLGYRKSQRRAVLKSQSFSAEIDGRILTVPEVSPRPSSGRR